MSSLQHKIDFAVVLRVKHANPNGDPLNGNRPRTDYNGYGEITDVCIKRKLRDRLVESGHNIFVQSDDRKKRRCKELAGSGGESPWQQVRLQSRRPSWQVRLGSMCALSASSLPCRRKAKLKGRTRTVTQACPFQSVDL